MLECSWDRCWSSSDPKTAPNLVSHWTAGTDDAGDFFGSFFIDRPKIAPRGPRIDFGSILDRFWVDFGSILGRFFIDFARLLSQHGLTYITNLTHLLVTTQCKGKGDASVVSPPHRQNHSPT